MLKLIMAFMKKELVQALRDPRMRILLFLSPLVQLTIFGLALDNTQKNVKLYARPMMNDSMLRDIKRDALGSGWFIPDNGKENTVGESIDLFRKGDLDVALYAPEGGLTKAYERGEGKIEAVIDGADLVRAQAVNGYLSSLVGMEAGYKLNKAYTAGFTAEAQVPLSNTSKLPIQFASTILYNPELESSYSLVPGVLSMLICIITIMLTSMSIAKEKEIGTFETLISAPVSVQQVLLGKTIPFMIIGCINLPMIFFIAVAGFDVPMKGSYIWLAVATVFFLITTVSIGTMISIVAKNQQQAMMGSFIFLMPAILLSGIMFPIVNMPTLLRIIAVFNPLMYFSVLLRNIMLKGGNIEVLATHTGALFLIAVVSAGTAFKKFKLNLG